MYPSTVQNSISRSLRGAQSRNVAVRTQETLALHSPCTVVPRSHLLRSRSQSWPSLMVWRRKDRDLRWPVFEAQLGQAAWRCDGSKCDVTMAHYGVAFISSLFWKRRLGRRPSRAFHAPPPCDGNLLFAVQRLSTMSIPSSNHRIEQPVNYQNLAWELDVHISSSPARWLSAHQQALAQPKSAQGGLKPRQAH